MSRTERLDPVVQHTDKKQQKALEAVVLTQNQVEIEKHKLTQLQSYRTEYLNKRNQTKLSCSAIELQEFNRFLAQLDDTIGKQIEVIKLREKELEGKRLSWQETRINSKVMHKVVENLQHEEEITQSRIEQKAMDEFSQRKFRNP